MATPKEVLRLTVPRQHVLAAMMYVSTEETRPILGHICFRPAADTGATVGGLLTIACNGHRLAEMTGGRWEGEWHAGKTHRELLVPPGHFSKKRANGLLGTLITVTLFDDDIVEVADNAAGHQHADHGLDARPAGSYPDYERVFRSYGRFAVAKDTTVVDAEYLESMGKLGAIFSDKPTRPMGVMLRRRKVGEKGSQTIWHPVLSAEAESDGAERTMRAMIMGLRDVR